jgi:hypothetical protein
MFGFLAVHFAATAEIHGRFRGCLHATPVQPVLLLRLCTFGTLPHKHGCSLETSVKLSCCSVP